MTIVIKGKDYLVKYPDLVEIELGEIPYMGDSYYDGILDAHDSNYFITLSGEQVCYCVEEGIALEECPSSKPCRCYDGIFLTYKIDEKLEYLLNAEKYRGKYIDFIPEVRAYCDSKPYLLKGYTLESKLKRV